ncbi:MAG: hypothetical protein IJO62_05790 [Clostridia bacterium]|nr:hypothetical protein [Clostridia bacterium]
MKKILCLILTVLMIFSVISLAGCGQKETLKLGYGMYSALSEVKNADGDNDGSAEALTTIAAVLLDKDGKIVKAAIDTAQNKINFTAKGEAIAPAEMKTKTELGDAYGMKAYAKAPKEWYEQKDAFISVIIGKTIDEVKALQVGDKGNDEVTAAGCTIKITEFIPALEKAVKSAKDSAATADDTLQLGVVSSQNEGKNAADGVEGVNEIMTTAIAVALNSKKEITAAKTDAVITAVKFDDKGVSTTEFGKEIATKYELGDNYGMKAYAKAPKEWYEQADAFDSKLIGKTADGIAAFADDTGKPAEDLTTAGCTINVNDMVKAAIKAATVK